MSGTSSDVINAIPGTPPSSNLVVHHLNNSRSIRIIWLLEELNVPYEIKMHTRGEDMLAPKEMKEVHPLGLAPIITDGGLTLAESGAIIEYLISKYGGETTQPPESGKIDNLYFTHYAEGSIMPLLVIKIICKLVPQRTPFFLRPIANMLFGGLEKQMVLPRIKQHSEYIEAHLAKTSGSFFAGGENPTSADFQMLYPMEIIFGMPDVPGPKIKEWVNKVHDRPAYKRALEKGGKYDVA